MTPALAIPIMTSPEVQTIFKGGRRPIVGGLELYRITLFRFLVAGHLITT